MYVPNSRVLAHIRKTTLVSSYIYNIYVLIDFSLTVKAATLIFISGCASAISSAKEDK